MADDYRFLEMLVKRRKTFEQEPYDAIDALVFSNMAGMPLRGIVASLPKDGEPNVTISVNSVCKAILSRNRKENFLNADSKRFLAILRGSPRYKEVDLCAYLNTYDKENVTGISAVTAILPKPTGKSKHMPMGEMVVAYAGTGAEIERWIENLRLLYAESVPAQKAALGYMEGVADLFPENWIHAAGYSKGDRFATEAAMKLSEGSSKRLASLYCVDGPGFNERIARSTYWHKKYVLLKMKLGDKMRTLSPEKMIVGGLLLDMPGKTRDFFKTDGENFLCHDLYNFRFKNGDFAVVEGNKPHPGYIRFCEALQKTLMKFSMERRVSLVDSLECIIKTHDIVTFADLATVLQKPKVFESIGNLSVAEKAALTTFAANLVTNIKKEKFDYNGNNSAMKALNTAKKVVLGDLVNPIPRLIRVLGAFTIVVDAVLDAIKDVFKKIGGFFKRKPKEEAIVADSAERVLPLKGYANSEKTRTVRQQRRAAKAAGKKMTIGPKTAGTGRGAL